MLLVAVHFGLGHGGLATAAVNLVVRVRVHHGIRSAELMGASLSTVLP